MIKEKLKKIYLNWKGIEFFNSIKNVIYILSTLLSIVFIFTSSNSPQSYLVFGMSIILTFLQFLKEDKESAKKYEEIFEKVISGKKISSYKEWVDFLDRTHGLSPLYLLIIGKIGYNKKFKEVINGAKIQTT